MSKNLDPRTSRKESKVQLRLRPAQKEMIARAAQVKQTTLSVPELLSADWYCRGDLIVYFQGALLVDCILRHFGGAKFFELCSICRPETIADDLQGILGLDPRGLDELYWADVRKTVAGSELPDRARVQAQLGLPDPGPEDPAARRDFLSNCPKAAQRLRDAYRRSTIAARITAQRPAKKASDQPYFKLTRFERQRDGDRVCVVKRQNGITEVDLVNAASSLRFSRKGEDDEALPFTPVLLPGGAKSRDILFTHAFELSQFIAPYALSNADFTEWLALPSFKVTRVAGCREGNRFLVRVSFDNSRRNAAGEELLQAGWIVLAPNDAWSVQQYELRTKAARGREVAVQQGCVRYGPTSDGIPCLAFVRDAFVRKGKPTYSVTTEIERFEFGPPPESLSSWVACSHDAKRRSEHGGRHGDSMPTRGCAA